jgi:hypothetical protein
MRPRSHLRIFLPGSHLLLEPGLGAARVRLRPRHGHPDRYHSPGAFEVEEHYRRFGPMVLRQCRTLLRSDRHAEDAMHDVSWRFSPLGVVQLVPSPAVEVPPPSPAPGSAAPVCRKRHEWLTGDHAAVRSQLAMTGTRLPTSREGGANTDHLLRARVEASVSGVWGSIRSDAHATATNKATNQAAFAATRTPAITILPAHELVQPLNWQGRCVDGPPAQSRRTGLRC